MKLSIIIVNYNVKYFLEQCLHSVLSSDINFEYEVLIVDNNSSDGSVDYLKSRFFQSNVNFIENEQNLGFAKANNCAIKQAKGEYILLLNPDTIVGEQVISEACKVLDGITNAGAVGVKMINGQGFFLPESKRGFPTPWAAFCKISGLASLFPKVPFLGGYNLNYLDENKMHEVDVLVGAFMMIRRSALDKSGLFDESFFMYGEDIDLSYRIVKAGYVNYYLPEKIIHFKEESSAIDKKAYNKTFHDAMRIFFKKYYPHNFLLSLFVSFGIRMRSFIVSLKKTEQRKNTHIEVLNTGKLRYKDIIAYMDKHKDKKLEFRIYNLDTKTTIGDNFAEYTI